MGRVIVGLSVVVSVSACTAFDRHGQLRNVEDGSQAELVLRNTPKNGGKARATFPSGESCEGELRTVPNGPRDAFGEETSQKGTLVLTCERGRIISCELVREASGPGTGTCSDSTHAKYILRM